MSVTYSKTISTDFPNGVVSPYRLQEEIKSSSISTTLEYVSTEGVVCYIWFVEALSAEEITTLNSLVSNHSGEPWPSKVASQIRFSSKSLGISSTTSKDWQTKMVLQTDPLVAGEYRVGWSFVWGMSRNTKVFEARILLDGNLIGYLIQKPFGASSGSDSWGSDTVLDLALPVMGFAYETFDESGEHTVSLQYRSTHKNTEAFIAMARLEVW